MLWLILREPGQGGRAAGVEPRAAGNISPMASELLLLGTAGAPLPVAGRAGICSAVLVDGRVFLVDCGRGAPSGYVDAGLDFRALEAVFVTHLHVDHVGDLPGMILYPWGAGADPAPAARLRAVAAPARSRRATPTSGARRPSTRSCPRRACPTWSGTPWTATPTT